MRNLRKLTAVVLAIALVLTSMTAAFAASTFEFEAQATTLKDLGIWEGSNGDLMLDKELTRAEGAVMVLKIMFGKTDADQKAADATALDAFDDAAAVPGWATGWMSLAVANKVVTGSESKDGTVKLNAAAPLKGKDLASMFMNALGLSDVNEYSKAVELLAAQTKGTILADIAADLQDAELTRDAATAIVYDALTATAKGATKTVIETYVGTDATLKAIADKAGLIVAPAALDVASVSATNLRELVVTFNKAPNADDAKKAANYKIGANNPDSATLSEDGKTVTLRTSHANKMSNYATDVELTILKAVGFTADKVIKSISVKDVTPVSVKTVSATGPRNIKVIISEPLNEATAATLLSSAFKVDGGLIGIESATVSGIDVTIKTYSDLAEGSHKVEVINPSKIVDSAEYPLQGGNFAFDYKKDISALSFTVVESNETSVTIQFNKALKSNTFAGNTNVKVTHTYNTATNEVTGSNITTSDDQKFVITFGATKPFPPAATTVYINYVSDSGTKIEDNYGNKLAATTFTVTTTADLTKPTATAEFVDATTVKVTFSEDVKDSGDNAGNKKENYTLKTGTDTISISGAAFDGDSKKVVKLTTATMNGGTYTLNIKNVKDTSVAGNQMDEVTLTFTGTDKVAPTVKTAVLASAKKFKITFSEIMDASSVTDKSVYKLATGTTTAALADKDTVELVDGNKAVVITFDVAPTAAANYTLLMGRVKDLAGNWIEAYETQKTFTGANVALVPLKEFQITGKNSIKVVIEDTLQNVNYSDFQFSTDSGLSFTTARGISESTVVDGKTYVTIVTTDLPDTIGNTLAVKTSATVSGENTFGSKLSFNTTTSAISAIDKCAPTYTTVVGITTGSTMGLLNGLDTTGMAIVIDYSEVIYGSSVQESDFTVSGYTVAGLSVSSDLVILYVNESDASKLPVSGTDIKIKQVGEITDWAKNVLGAQDEWTAKVD